MRITVIVLTIEILRKDSKKFTKGCPWFFIGQEA